MEKNIFSKMLIIFSAFTLVFGFFTICNKIKHPAIEKADLTQISESKTETKPVYIELKVVATAYCPCVKCSEGYGRLTSTGAIAAAGRTIAVDPSIIPYGSKVIINGHTYIAEDCGAAIKGNKIDIFFDSHEEALQFGKQTIIIKVSKAEFENK